METCSRILNLDQISFNNILGCASELKCNEQGSLHLPLSGPKEVICPEPRRAAMVPYIVDGLNRSCCKPKRNFPSHRGSSSLDIFNLFLNKDDIEDELDATSSQMDFVSCSPPVRTNNPLVHDVQFIRQTSVLGSPPRNTHGVKYSSAKVEEAPFHGTSTGEKPIVRIVGFASGGSKSHCISALA
ncbi:hypothetical protein L1049_002143 [Liquidambar formosana]|uniref:Uncharacterized protein n=1 Tax=Liquidambar formosana TaxID=63359 RepID=A0AAP0NIU5_LIQFO